MSREKKEAKKAKNAVKSKNKYVIVGVIICILVVAVVLGVYFLKDKNDTNQGKKEDLVLSSYQSKGVAMLYDTTNEKDVLYNPIVLGGELAYSIDYDCDTPTSDTLSFRKYLSDAGMAVMMNGYPNKSLKDMGVNTIDEAYIATQIAIWEIMNRTGESKNANSVFRVEDTKAIEGKEDSYNRIINAVKKLVQEAEDNPYTDIPVMKIGNSNVESQDFDDDEVLIGPYTITIEGTGADTIKAIKASLIDAPKSARVTDKNGNDKTLMSSGDSVYIRMDSSEDDSTFKIQFEAFVNRKVGEIYEEKNEATQHYLKLGTQSDYLKGDSTIEWSTVTTIGTLELECVDEDDNPVVGATFELLSTEGKVYDELDTGTDGKIMFYGMPVGKYIVREKNVPDGYEIQKKSKTVTIKAAKITTVKFINSTTK